MTLNEWKLNKDLSAWAAKVFMSEHGQAFLRMLNDSHPRHSQIPSSVSDSSKSTELGRVYGYDMAINNIESSCYFNTPAPELTESFGVPKPEPKKEKK